MSCNKEIGGYFSLECGSSPLYHPEGIYLNSGRNALRHIIRSCKIKKLYVPDYTCPVVNDAVSRENCEIILYELNQDFIPINKFPKDAFVLCNNYFGVCGKQVQSMVARYPNLIVDNAQSFFSAPCGLASFYSPRKFFGLPDGGIAFCKSGIDQNYPIDTSSDFRFSHLLSRSLRGASEGYAEFCKNDASFDKLEIMKMSSLTLAIMGNIDYNGIREKRLKNFQTLHQLLEPEKKWDLASDDVPMIYPYFTKDADLKRYLINNNIFVATYWPGLTQKYCDMHFHLVPLPLDQRYNTVDMEYIVDVIKRKNKSCSY